jgi:tRNA(Ile)-lysidine synthase
MATLSSLEPLVAAFVQRNAKPQAALLVAVSGGADSVALLRLLHAVWNCAGEPGQGGLAVAHFNHALRGSCSDDDAQFVESLCRQLQVPCVVGKLARQTHDAGTSSENFLRTERYSFLINTAKQIGAQSIATAHTADDQVETVLHRVLRGTGIRGLTGIRPRRRLTANVQLVRPLLTVRRQHLVEYLQSIQQPWREDASNDDPRYFRNRLRNKLLPLLRAEYQANVDQSLLRLAASASGAQKLQNRLAARLEKRFDEYENSLHSRLHLRHFEEDSTAVIVALFQRMWRRQNWPMGQMTHQHWLRLIELLGDPHAVADFPGKIRATRRGAMLVLTRQA